MTRNDSRNGIVELWHMRECYLVLGIGQTNRNKKDALGGFVGCVYHIPVPHYEKVQKTQRPQDWHWFVHDLQDLPLPFIRGGRKISKYRNSSHDDIRQAQKV